MLLLSSLLSSLSLCQDGIPTELDFTPSLEMPLATVSADATIQTWTARLMHLHPSNSSNMTTTVQGSMTTMASEDLLQNNVSNVSHCRTQESSMQTM